MEKETPPYPTVEVGVSYAAPLYWWAYHTLPHCIGGRIGLFQTEACGCMILWSLYDTLGTTVSYAAP